MTSALLLTQTSIADTGCVGDRYFRRRKPKRPLHLDSKRDAPRGVHNIVDWAASPWEVSFGRLA